MMSIISTIVMAGVVSGCGGGSTAVQQNPGDGSRFNEDRTFQLKDLQNVTVTIGGQKFQTWVMDTAAKRQEGFMFVRQDDIRDDQAMIFAFDREIPLSFWMHNTYMPLDIVYLDKNKKVINIVLGKPLDDTSLPSKKPGMFVLEFKLGTMEKLKVKEGDVATWPDSVKSKDTEG